MKTWEYYKEHTNADVVISMLKRYCDTAQKVFNNAVCTERLGP